MGPVRTGHGPAGGIQNTAIRQTQPAVLLQAATVIDGGAGNMAGEMTPHQTHTLGRRMSQNGLRHRVALSGPVRERNSDRFCELFGVKREGGLRHVNGLRKCPTEDTRVP